MNVSRVALGIAGVAISALFYKDALGYPEAAAQMPLIYSVAVALFSLALIVAEILGRKRREGNALAAAANSDGAPMEEGFTNRKGKISVAVIFALAVVYIPLIGVLGYLVSTLLFMTAALLVIRTVSLKASSIGIAVLVAVISLVFIGFLGLPIPLLPTFL